jgi:hypothetical protein
LLNFMLFAVGFGALVLTLFACVALYRLGRALAALEDTLVTADEAMRALVPEVHGSLASVNAITAGLNEGLHVAGHGASHLTTAVARSSGRASATLHGVRVGARSLWRNLTNH